MQRSAYAVVMLSLLFFLPLAASTFAQTPVGVTASIYEPSAPELQAYVTWMPVPGATKYNVYQAPASSLDSNIGCSKPTWGPIDATVTENYYLDDPNAEWWQMPVNSTWRSRMWCYSVTAIVNGVESAKSKPAFVAIGWSGYLTFMYYTACNGQRVVPFPYTADQIVAHFYYIDPTGVKTELPAINLYNAYGSPIPGEPYNEEWEFKAPVIAANGTVIPWNNQGKYEYTVKTPDGGNESGLIAPLHDLDQSTYTQRTIIRIQGKEDCPLPPDFWGNYDVWQNVTI